jgi:amino acid transporter
VGQELHPALGYVTGWSMVMDYVLNPLICTAICAKLMMNVPYAPALPFYGWAVIFAVLFTVLNLRGVRTSARIDGWLCAGMMVVVVVFLGAVVRYVAGLRAQDAGFFLQPFYDKATFSSASVFRGTSVAVLTYIGFDAISTLSEEAENPKRNILLATVLVCVAAGVLSAVEVYAAQLVWGSKPFPADQVESAFPLIARQAGGVVLFHVLNFTLLVANMGSGMGAQLAAGRLLYGMGRGNALPRWFFGAIDPQRHIPRNNIIAVGAVALAGATLLEFFASRLGGGAYEIGAQALNFGAFIAFMGVNAAAFARSFATKPERTIGNLLPPVLGFVICFSIWLNLSRPAQVVGALWMAVGIAYGAYRTRGFTSELVNFDIPEE